MPHWSARSAKRPCDGRFFGASPPDSRGHGTTLAENHVILYYGGILSNHYAPVCMVRSLPPWLASIALSCAILLSSAPALAQNVSTSRSSVTIEFSGQIQPRLSYGWVENGNDRLGYGLRRARLATTATLNDQAGVYLRFNAGAGNVAGVDAYAFYNSGAWRFRAGRFAGPQPRAFNLTSSQRIDAIDRAAVSERWGQRTIGSDGRDFGVAAQWQRPQTTWALMVSAGDGSWDRARGLYRESISSGDVTRGGDQAGLAVTLATQHQSTRLNGLVYGAFAGVNTAESPTTDGRTYSTYGAHLYYGANPGSQPLRAKLDVIGLRFEEVGDVRESSLGVSLLGAARIHEAAEVYARYEHDDLTGTIDQTQFVTGGASLSLSRLRNAAAPYHHERVTLGYMLQLPEDSSEPRQQLLVVQLQYTF